MSNDQLGYSDPKEQMLKSIATLWGTKNIDSLDPLVRILVEALSGELCKTHNVIHSFEKRMLERLALLMTPASLSTPYCAHAVAQAFPNEPIEYLEPADQFIYSKKMNNEQVQNIQFSPIDKIPVFDATIKYMIINNSCWMIDEFQQKSMHVNRLDLNSNKHLIWIGVKINDEITNLNGLSFYFNQSSPNSIEIVKQLLSESEWFIGGKKLQMRIGCPYMNKYESNSILSQLDVIHMIEKEVKYLYDACFIHIEDQEVDFKTEYLQKYPEVFKQFFPESKLSTFQEDLLWIKIVPDFFIQNEDLSDIDILINAFPVLNRKGVNHVSRTKKISNSIALRTSENEFFLSVFSVENELSIKYKELPFAANSFDNYTYTIRKGGMERMDTRDAKEYLEYIIELMRDESAIFSAYGQDAVATILKELNQLVSQLSQRVNKSISSDVDICSYLFPTHAKSDETYFIDYWVTNAIHANGISAGTKLSYYKGSKFKKDSLFLKTATVGGKYALSPDKHMDAYKYASLTHNKIVTVEDIKACCVHELGDKIDRYIVVRKGLVLSPNPKHGLIRCVEVFLKKNVMRQNADQYIDWNMELKNLQSKLELRSALNMTIKVYLH